MSLQWFKYLTAREIVHGTIFYHGTRKRLLLVKEINNYKNISRLQTPKQRSHSCLKFSDANQPRRKSLGLRERYFDLHTRKIETFRI